MRRAMKARAFVGDRREPDKATPVETHAEYLQRKTNGAGIPLDVIPWDAVYRRK